MIGTWHPERFIALHTLKTHHNVFQGHSKGMTSMEAAIGVWRGHNEGKRLAVACARGVFCAENLGKKATFLSGFAGLFRQIIWVKKA